MSRPRRARRAVVRVDALETFVELLTRVEADGSSDAFYSSLCEAVCRLTSMDRAVIFRYDEARRRVRAAGAFGLDLDRFADSHVTVESAPIARQALVEDRVIEMDAETVAREVPERFRDLLDDSDARLRPALGRRPLERRDPRRPPPAAAALRRGARPAVDARQDLRAGRGRAPRDVPAGARARQLQERIDLAREVHEGVIQRLFGVLLVVSSDAPLPRRGARARDGRAPGRRCATCAARCSGRWAGRRARRRRRCRRRSRGCATSIPTSGSCCAGTARTSACPRELEPLAQSVLVEAVRNARQARAADARRGAALARQDGAWVMEVCNDGVGGAHARRSPGWGSGSRRSRRCRSAGSSSSASASRGPGGCDWRCRMSVPDVNPSRIASGSGERKLRVLVVDDHEVVHWGLRLMLGEQPWVERCLSARNGEEAMALLAPLPAARRARRPVRRPGVGRGDLRAAARGVADDRTCC